MDLRKVPLITVDGSGSCRFSLLLPLFTKSWFLHPHSKVSSSPGTAVAEALWAHSSLCFFLWKQTREPICLEPPAQSWGRVATSVPQFLFTTLRLLCFYPPFPHIPPLWGRIKILTNSIALRRRHFCSHVHFLSEDFRFLFSSWNQGFTKCHLLWLFGNYLLKCTVSFFLPDFW